MNANYYSEKAVDLMQLDQELKTKQPEGHTVTKDLARYHLRAAAMQLRAIAEGLAKSSGASA